MKTKTFKRKTSNFHPSLHKTQAEVFNDKRRYKLLVCGRRWGKSRLSLTLAILAVLLFNQPIDPASPPVVVVCMPTLKQVKAVHWQPLLKMLQGSPFVEEINRAENRIKFKGNKPDIILRGVNDDEGDSLRGLKIYYAVLDEFQDIKPAIWNQVIYPALGDTANSSAILVGTPKGRNHPLYEFYKAIKEDPDWAFFHYTTKDNPFFPKSQLREAKKAMPAKVYRQEFQASWEDFDGQIYSELADHHYINENAIPENCSYYIGVDWGDVNPAIVVVAKSKIDDSFYIVDAWHNPSNNVIVENVFLEKVAELCRKYNVYRCFLPDDRPSAINACRKLGIKLKLFGMQRAVQVSRLKPGVLEGCQAINNLFYQNNLYINSKLIEFKEQIESYAREIDQHGRILNRPAKKQSSHLPDAMRYVIATLAINELKLKVDVRRILNDDY